MKKIIYRDALNVQREVAVYEETDFVKHWTPSGYNKPVMTGPDGFIDASLLNASVSTATVLQVFRIAEEEIQPGDCLMATSDTHVRLASCDGTQAEATAFGFAVNGVSAGGTVSVVFMGALKLAVFSVFAVNQPLYLDVEGAITDERQTTGYLTPVGKSLGNSTIMIQLGFPTKLGG